MFYSIKFYAISSLINCLLGASLAFYILYKSRRLATNRHFAYFILSISVWSLFYFCWLSTTNKEWAYFFVRTCMIGVLLIPSTFTGFATSLVRAKLPKSILRANYLFSFLLIPFVYTSLYAENTGSFLIFPYWPTPGPLFHIAVFHFALNTAYSHILMFKAFKRSKDKTTKNQILYVLLAGIFGFFGGSINFLPWYRIPILPVTTILVSLWVILPAYAILRYQLMDIEVIIKKTLVFASLFAIIFGIFVGITILTQEILAGGRLFGLAISSLIIIFAVEPLKNFLIRITDKYLFQKKYNPMQLIKTFTDDVLTLLNLRKLMQTTVQTLVKTLNLRSCGLYLLNKNEDKYELQGSYNMNNGKATLDADSDFVRYVSRVGYIEIPRQNSNQAIRQKMKEVNAILAMPLVLHKQMIGILCLGSKKSDEDYTKEDIDILSSLAKAEAIAISNAKLFAEATQNAKLASIGALSAGINHEVCNPLNRMLSSMQIFIRSRKMGLYKDKKDGELLETCEGIMMDMMNDIRKIAGITKKLSDFAKPGRQLAAERVEISQSLQEAMDVLGHELELKRIEFVKDIKERLFIMADRDQLQEIFFNIIRNAVQAIEEKGKIVFTAQKRKGDVIIEIKDTGSGMPEEKIEKIYDPFYSTKGEGKGTGLGLAIVKQLVIRNKGTIHVESRVGEGTAFKLSFPEAV